MFPTRSKFNTSLDYVVKDWYLFLTKWWSEPLLLVSMLLKNFNVTWAFGPVVILLSINSSMRAWDVCASLDLKKKRKRKSVIKNLCYLAKVDWPLELKLWKSYICFIYIYIYPKKEYNFGKIIKKKKIKKISLFNAFAYNYI